MIRARFDHLRARKCEIVRQAAEARTVDPNESVISLIAPASIVELAGETETSSDGSVELARRIEYVCVPSKVSSLLRFMR